MSFTVYRKHQKLLLLLATIISVVVFVLFPSFGDVTSSISGRDSGDVIGRFTVSTTDEQVTITQGEYERTAQRLASFVGRGSLTEDMVWQHLMLVADARGAGLAVSDEDIVFELTQQFPELDLEQYTFLWKNQLGFASARAFEDFFKERILVQRWIDALSRQASIVDADEVYQRWRLDNELFDMAAVVFDDADPQSVPDPGDEVLQAYFDATPVYLRERRYAEPARYDIAYAWLPLDSDLTSLPADKLAELPEVADADAELRFNQLKAQRFPDMESADEATLALLRDELMVTNLVSEAHRAWVAAKDEAVGPAAESGTVSKMAFSQLMSAFGLRLGDPEGLLGPDELESLEDIGTPTLAAQLTSMTVGQTRYFRPFGEDQVAEVVFVEELQESQPLEFAEARQLVLDQWRQEDAQRAAAATAFREGLTAAARALPEAAELIAPLEADALTAAEARITEAQAAAVAAAAEGEEPEAVDAEAIRAEELEIVEPAIESRLAEFEARFWDEAVAAAQALGGDDVRTLSLSGVSKAYRLDPDGDEAADSLERFLKINGQVQQQQVDGITPVLRFAAGKASVVVRVTDRRFPDKADMLADKESFEASRERAAQTNGFTFQIGFNAQAIMGPRTADNPYGHSLEKAAPLEPAAAEGDDTGS